MGRAIICIVVQSLSHIQLFATPWTAAYQAFLSFTISWSFLKLMSIESVMPCNHLILCHPFSFLPQSLPASGSFPMSWLFLSGGQSIGVSPSASVLPKSIQDWFPGLRVACLLNLATFSGVFKIHIPHSIPRPMTRKSLRERIRNAHSKCVLRVISVVVLKLDFVEKPWSKEFWA